MTRASLPTKKQSTATRNLTKRAYRTSPVELAARAFRIHNRGKDFVRPAEWRTDCEQCGVPLTGLRSRYCSRLCGTKAWHAEHLDKYDAWTTRRRRANPEIHNARLRVMHAVRDGQLAKPDICSDCGKTSEHPIEGHHHKGYVGPAALDVVWLCKKCHAKQHPRGKAAA